MKKLLGVALIGGLLLLFVLRYTAHDPAAMAAAATAAAPVASVPAQVAPVATAAVAPTVGAPIATAAQAPTANPPALASDDSACARLSELCSTSDQKVDVAGCRKQLDDARRMAGAANVERSETCIADAKTCAAAGGCLSGGVAFGAMGEYLKGLGTALSH